MGLLDTKYCTCGYELEAEKLLHTIWLDGRGIEVELCICPRCGRYSFYQPRADRKDRYRAECGGKTDEELNVLLELPDTPELLREAERESAPRGGFFSNLFGGRDDEDKPRKNQPPEF